MWGNNWIFNHGFDAFAPHPVNRGLDHGLHAADKQADGDEEGLLNFYLGDDGALAARSGSGIFQPA